MRKQSKWLAMKMHFVSPVPNLYIMFTNDILSKEHKIIGVIHIPYILIRIFYITYTVPYLD